KVAGRPTYNYDDSERTLRRKKAKLKKAAQNTKSITSYLSLTNSLRFNAINTIVINEDEDTIMVDNTVDSIVESVEINVNDDKACIKRAIKELDNMLEKDSKQIDKGTKAGELIKQGVFVYGVMSAELEPLLIEYDENDLTLVKKNIPLNQKPHCIITHDETTLATNDDKKTRWGPEGEQKLHPKRRGRCIYISEFLCEPLGCIHLTVEQHLAHSEISNRYVTETLEVGVNHDGYWNIQLLAEQLKRTIDVLEIVLPGTIFVFAFDNSSSHGAFVEDALVASKINVKYGGKQPRMHSGRLPDSISQEIIFSLDYKN
ncbi:25561_t:CDS:2, partial [Racocetra persica]